MPAPEIVTVMIAKAAGSLMGSIVALVFMPPTGLREFYSRFFVSAITGVFFASTAQDKLGLSNTFEGHAAAAFAVGFSGWWVLGAIIRVVRGWNPPK